VGGGVRTDSVDGFLLDRGFQILLSAYPQVRQRLDPNNFVKPFSKPPLSLLSAVL
jgi:hypothetical protein